MSPPTLEQLSKVTTVTGSLSELGAIELLQSIHDSKRSARLVLHNGDDAQAIVLFRNGDIIDAELGPLRGESVLYATFTWGAGSFEVEFRESDRPDSLRTSTRRMLWEGRNWLEDRARRIARLPDLGAVFVVDPVRLLEKLAELPDELNLVLKLFDGESCLRDIIEKCELDELSTLSAFSRLLGDAIIRDAAFGMRSSIAAGPAPAATGRAAMKTSTPPSRNTSPPAGMTTPPPGATVRATRARTLDGRPGAMEVRQARISPPGAAAPLLTRSWTETALPRASAPPTHPSSTPGSRSAWPGNPSTAPGAGSGARASAAPARPSTHPAQSGTGLSRPPGRPVGSASRPSLPPARPSAVPASASRHPGRPSAVPLGQSVHPPRLSGAPINPSAYPLRPSAAPRNSSAYPARPSAAPHSPSLYPATPSAAPRGPSLHPARPSAAPPGQSLHPAYPSAAPPGPPGSAIAARESTHPAHPSTAPFAPSIHAAHASAAPAAQSMAPDPRSATPAANAKSQFAAARSSSGARPSTAPAGTSHRSGTTKPSGSVARTTPPSEPFRRTRARRRRLSGDSARLRRARVYGSNPEIPAAFGEQATGGRRASGSDLASVEPSSQDSMPPLSNEEQPPLQSAVRGLLLLLALVLLASALTVSLLRHHP